MGIDGFMTQTVRIASRSASTGDGQGSFGTSKPYKARVEPYNKMVYGSDGALHQAHARIFMAAKAPVTTDCDLTLPDGQHAEVLEVRPIMDSRTVHHIEVIV
jgi:hypothetical protein